MVQAALPGQRPRVIRSRTTNGDKAFRGLLRAGGVAVFAIMALIALFLALRSSEAFRVAGRSFLTEKLWQSAGAKFGVASVVPNGVFIALVALAFAVPLSMLTALFIAEYAPAWLRGPMIAVIDVMAAIPSIVYGIWGLFFLQPHIVGVIRWAANHLGFIPIFEVRTGDYATSYTSSILIGGIVVGLMITPIITSLTREVFSQAPPGEREGAYALGATRWGMIRSVVLPYGKGGAIGAIMLGFGRAMGETITIALIVAPAFDIHFRILESGGMSVSALIALNFPNASGISLAALMAAGLVLFAITLIVNMLAAVVIARSRSGVETG